jgi:hypothetical protein
VVGGVVLELVQESTADVQGARGLGNPHALDVGGSVVVELERPAADRVCTKPGRQEKAGWRPQFLLVRWDAQRGIEARIEPTVELGEVRVQAMLRVRVCGIGRRDLDHRGGQEPLDVCHGGDQVSTLLRAEGCEKRCSQLVAALAIDSDSWAEVRRDTAWMTICSTQ